MKMVLVEGKRQKRGGCSCGKENRRNVVVVVVGAKEKHRNVVDMVAVVKV